MGKVICDVCKKKCRGDVLKLDKKFMHKTCFNCFECGRSLDEGGFYCRDSKYYCRSDYQLRFGVKCGICHQYVDGEVVMILGGTFHSDCFQCQMCRKPLNCGDKATLWDNLYLCDQCCPAYKENICPQTNGGLVTHAAASQVQRECATSTSILRSSTLSCTDSPQPSDSTVTQLNGGVSHKDTTPVALHLENGYTSTDSGVEKTKSEMAYLSQHSPEYSMTSGDESWLHSSRHRKIKTNPYQFGKYYNESYLKIQERLERTNPPRSNYGTKASTLGPESTRNQQFHRPNNFSYRSSPNIHMKKGMSLLAQPTSSRTSNIAHFHKSQSLTAPANHINGVVSVPPSSDNAPPALSSQSTNDLCISQDYVRRLAHFPNATEPDSGYQPPIDRYDFPAPPSISVLLQDRKRASRVGRPTDQRSYFSCTEASSGARRQQSGGSNKVMSTGDITSSSDMMTGDEQFNRRQKRLRQINQLRQISTKSGLSQSLLDELEESVNQEASYEDDPNDFTITNGYLSVDPISASRSPDASTEPKQRPRFERHTFTSPSRDNRFEGRPVHCLSYRMNYSNTGGRMPGNLSGYTSNVENDSAARSMRSYRLFNSAIPGSSSGVANAARGYMSCVEDHPRHHTDSSSLSLQQRAGHSSALGPGGRHVSGGAAPGPSRQHQHHHRMPSSPMGYMNGHHMTPSMTTSGYSMDATTTRSIDESTLIGGEEVAGAGEGPSEMAPGSSSGARAGGYMSDYVGGVGGHHAAHTYSSDGFYCYDSADEQSAAAAIILKSQYPTVQSYLRPSSFLRSKQKVPAQVYPYELLKISHFKLPRGVDRQQLETYLNDDDFNLVFQMSRSAFKKLPEWKRNDLKRKVDLY